MVSADYQQAMPSFLKEFRMIKLKSMIRDLQRLDPDELVRIQKEIEVLLHPSRK